VSQKKNLKPYITIYDQDKKLVAVTSELFRQHQSYLIDSIRNQLAYVYNHAKEIYTTPRTLKINMGQIKVETNLKGGMTFSPKTGIRLSKPNFKKAIKQIVNDVSSFQLTYGMADDFLILMREPEMWALLIFVGADQYLTDLLINAEKDFFDGVWMKSTNVKQIEIKKSIIAIVDALRAGKSIDLSTLIFYDKNGNKVSLSGKIYPCKWLDNKKINSVNYCNNEISLYLMSTILTETTVEVLPYKETRKDELLSQVILSISDYLNNIVWISVSDSGTNKNKKFNALSANKTSEIYFDDLSTPARLLVVF